MSITYLIVLFLTFYAVIFNRQARVKKLGHYILFKISLNTRNLSAPRRYFVLSQTSDANDGNHNKK